MSNVNLLIINNENVYFLSIHYKTLIWLLENDFNKILEVLKRKTYLDAGFIVLDNNQKLIINSQNAFDIYSIKQKRFNVVNI